MWQNHFLHPPQHRSGSLSDKLFHCLFSSTAHPPSTLIIILNCFTSYPGYCGLSSHLSGPGRTWLYYTTKAVRGPITKINQSDSSIAGPIISKYWTGYCPEWSRVVSRFQPEIKMADDSSFVSRCFWCWPSIRQKEAWNNSGRKTSISRLFNGNFPKNYLRESGHKNIKRVFTNSRAVLTTNVRCPMHSPEETR